MVKSTINFDDFSLIKANRPVDWGKIAVLRKEIKRKNLTKEYPVNVNSKSASKKRYGLDGTKIGVVDGQHRYISCKLERVPMYYQVVDTLTLDDIPRAAAVQSSWKMKDFIHHHAVEGKQQYMLFRSYMERNNFAPSSTLTILCGDRSKHTVNRLKNGELNITRHWAEANAFADAIGELGEFISFNKQARFLEAYNICFQNKEFNHSRMITKLEYLSSRMKRMTDTYSHLEQLESVYNFNTKNNKVKLNTIQRVSF
jgi:hypothetical protein|tara:strand:- start:294 stop:1061 length:768 start_codon:yes stop_codon:yes gene_type:complete